MRALWNGSISFGLVNIPVRLYSASQERALQFHLFDKKDMSPISYKKVRKSDEKAVEQKDIVKGYEVEKGEYVTLESEDFKRANARKTETIDIVQFADIDEIDPKFFDKPYYLEPEKKAMKAYALLRDALQKTQKAGIATYVLRDKERFGALIVEDDVITLMQLRYLDEIRSPEGLHIPEHSKYSARELEMAETLIHQQESPFKPEKYKDTFTSELLRVIKSKKRGKTRQVPVKSPIQPTDMEDILGALKRSLEATDGGGRRRKR